MSARRSLPAYDAQAPRRRLLCAALAVTAFASLGGTGCARYYYGSAALSDPFDLVEANYRAADVLLQTAPLDLALPVLVATVVQVDRLGESSRLGRLITEHVAGRLAQRGVRVTELKLRETLAMRPSQGELLLSREARDVTQAQTAQAVVVGTYAVSSGSVFVSLKLVNPLGNTVLAACDYALPMDATVRELVMAQ